MRAALPSKAAPMRPLSCPPCYPLRPSGSRAAARGRLESARADADGEASGWAPRPPAGSDLLDPSDRIVCRLRFQHEGRERIFTIGERPVVIGRSPECDLHLAHDSISRQHARIAYEEDGWVLTDLGSKNGSRVNTFHVDEQVLRNGDRLDLGTIRLYVEIGSESHASRARVIFEEQKAPSLQTQVLDLRDLDDLLQGAGDRHSKLSPFTDRLGLSGIGDDLDAASEAAAAPGASIVCTWAQMSSYIRCMTSTVV